MFCGMTQGVKKSVQIRHIAGQYLEIRGLTMGDKCESRKRIAFDGDR